MQVISTRDAARLLEVHPAKLSRMIWDGRLPEPTRGPARAFIWSEADLARAARLLGRPAPVTNKGATGPTGGVEGGAHA